MWMSCMFINTHVSINSSVVYKLWVGGREGGGGEGSWNISSRVPTPPPSPPRLRYGIYGSQDLVRNCNCTVWFFVC